MVSRRFIVFTVILLMLAAAPVWAKTANIPDSPRIDGAVKIVSDVVFGKVRGSSRFSNRLITIVSAVSGFGRGDSRECDETVPMTKGVFVMHSKGAVHYDDACDGEPVAVRIMGMGPVKTHWLESND